jgi:hypothetical protein
MNDLANQELNNCEIFLRAVLALEGEEASQIRWSQCQRHEWAAYKWDAKNEEIRLRNPHSLKVVDLTKR